MGRIFSQFWWRNMVENDTNATTVLLDSWLISLFTRWIMSSYGHMSLQMDSLNGSSWRDISFPQPSAIIRKVVNPVCWLQRLNSQLVMSLLCLKIGFFYPIHPHLVNPDISHLEIAISEVYPIFR
jgi:hypothetical protein